MAHITKEQAQAWAEGTKLTITALDQELESQLADEVVTQLFSAGIDTSTWLTAATTPSLVRTIIAKLYVAWVYDRAYSEDIEEGSNYAVRLKENAAALIAGLVAGDLVLPEQPTEVAGEPIFYPNDASSSQAATSEDPSLGPAAFSMGMRF
jgi:hypothetical protein